MHFSLSWIDLTFTLFLEFEGIILILWIFPTFTFSIIMNRFRWFLSRLLLTFFTTVLPLTLILRRVLSHFSLPRSRLTRSLNVGLPEKLNDSLMLNTITTLLILDKLSRLAKLNGSSYLHLLQTDIAYQLHSFFPIHIPLLYILYNIRNNSSPLL